MKKIIITIMLLLGTVMQPRPAHAQLFILEIIKAGVKKVIKAVDLQIQRQQNKVIWLQNAQKVLENAMSKLKLDQITDWTQKQKELYKEYFDELKKVKSLIAYYQRIREITLRQQQLVSEYKRAWATISNDKHFSVQEIRYISGVYSGILEESLKNLEQVAMVASSFRTEMTDAKRLELINKAAERMRENYSDLRRFNGQNAVLSLQRANSADEAATIKKLYGLP